MFQEIHKLLEVVVERNSMREALHRQRQNFEAWRQVSEVLLTACPEDLLSGERRQTVIFELLQELLCKVGLVFVVVVASSIAAPGCFHTISCLEESRVERGSMRQSSLKG